LTELPPEARQGLESLAALLSPRDKLVAARLLLADIDAGALPVEASAVAPAPAARALTVLYGSHSGHSAGIARQLASLARARGFPVELHDMADFPRGNLRRVTTLAVVVSTHGEGQPPESAAPFFEHLQGPRAPQLPECGFAVLALGDKTYPRFCQAGADADERLAALGATRLLPRTELDVDYQDGAEAWLEELLSQVAPRLQKLDTTTPPVSARPSGRIDREQPWSAELLEHIVLSGRGSTQRYAHLELSLAGSGLRYQPGDALGVRPENDPSLVGQLATTLGAGPDTPVTVDGTELPLHEALGRRREIRVVAPSRLRKYACLGAASLGEILATVETTNAYLRGRDWLDILREHPVGISAQEFVALLPELAPRSYSIASCQASHPDEVHLLVSQLRYDAHGRQRLGTASSHLVDRLTPGQRLPVWIEPNPRFRLPSDGSIPIVMIGAGTGVAPFRAFAQARAQTGASGPSWLVFGNRTLRSDFTYQAEWLKWREQGVLSRLSVAFSRDSSPKRYVTDVLRQEGRDLYDWLARGAALYLCGDRGKLSASTDGVLAEIVATHGGRSAEAAAQYVADLSAQNRYCKDVY
jgi:sulfite reductase (NADPH) flavoprotein alpha-component